MPGWKLATHSFSDLLGVLESVKAAADVNTPVGGTVAEVNTALTKQPELVNKDSYKEGKLLYIYLGPPWEWSQGWGLS